MTWQQISDAIQRKLRQYSSPPILPAEMVDRLNEAYNDLLIEWYKLTLERDENAIQLLAPLKQGPITPTLSGTIFYIDTAQFTGGLRWITAMRGLFAQSCNPVSEWRNIEFLPDNDLSDLENPLRKPTNDYPKYREWWDVGAGKKKITLECDSAPSDLKVFYLRQQVVITTVASGSPEISVEGHWDIVRRVVFNQAGINIDPRSGLFKAETDKDLSVKAN